MQKLHLELNWNLHTTNPVHIRRHSWADFQKTPPENAHAYTLPHNETKTKWRIFGKLIVEGRPLSLQKLLCVAFICCIEHVQGVFYLFEHDIQPTS